MSKGAIGLMPQSLLPLGVVTPRGDLSSAADLALAHPDDTVAFLRRHRVVGLGLRRLLEVTTYQRLPSPLKRLVGWRQDLDDLLNSGWRELGVAVRETGVPTAGIKGMCMRPEYARKSDRDAGDIDVVVKSVDEAWELATWLRGHGYDWCEYEWPWLKRDLRTHKIYGQFQVWKPESEHYLRFDIHFGGYSVRHCRLAVCAPNATGLSLIEPSANLACLLGNSSGDFLIRLKDVNDIAMLLQNGHLSHETDYEMIKSLGLERFWNTLVCRVLSLVSLTEIERDALGRLRVDGLPQQRVPFGVPSLRARTKATVTDAFLYGHRLEGPIRGLGVAWNAFQYYHRKHELTVSKCGHRSRGDLIPNMTNETCVRLIPTRLIRSERSPDVVPIEFASSRRRAIGGTSLLTENVADRHVFVEAGNERFVPTIFYQLCEFEAVGGTVL